MSLTRQLKLKDSSPSLFMRTHFPNTRRVMALCRGQMGQDFHTHRPNGQIPYALIGTALDYRLRFYFPQTGMKARVEDLVCYQGAAKACRGRIIYGKTDRPETIELLEEYEDAERLDTGLLLGFFAELKTVLERLQPAGRRLDKDDENLLLRYCVVMAALDTFFRAGFDNESILLDPEPKKTQLELLSVAEENWIDDLRTLSWNFHDTYQSLFTKPATLNPTFDGSFFVRGADADLIIDGCLIDIKTTINPLKDTDWIYQLLGYALLDWHDDNKIQEVAIYFSRQSYMMKWDLNKLMEELSGQPVNLNETRREWHDAITPAFFATFMNEESFSTVYYEYSKVDGMWKRERPAEG